VQRNPRRRRVHRTGAPFKGQLRLYLTALGALAALLLLIFLLRPSAQLLNAPEIARTQRLGVLRVGVLSDAPGFSVLDGSGADGLEIALAYELAKKIFPDIDPEVSVELVAVNQYTALPHIKRGDIDITFAMQRNTGSDSYSYSSVYFKDSVRLLCRSGDEKLPVNGRNIGLIEGGAAQAAWKSYEQETSAELKAVYYPSYPDLISALLAGDVDLIGVPGSLAAGLTGAGVSLSDTVLGSVGYVAVSSSESPAFALLADLEIQQMQRNGELNALIQRYGLTQYEG
jgi:ABC-type amino acid transport substrate-binding protein